MEDFVRARTEDQFNLRREMILNACHEIYESEGFLGVTFNNVAAKTSFTRPALYNYYKNREEMLLDLLRNELKKFQQKAEEVFANPVKMTKEEYARTKVELIADHPLLCHLVCDFDMIGRECDSEAVAEAKKKCYELYDFISIQVRNVFPGATEAQISSYNDASLVQFYGTFGFTHMDQKGLDAYRSARPGRSPPDFKWMLYNAEMCLLTLFENDSIRSYH